MSYISRPSACRFVARTPAHLIVDQKQSIRKRSKKKE
jgi:hypothetical protein